MGGYVQLLMHQSYHAPLGLTLHQAVTSSVLILWQGSGASVDTCCYAVLR